MEITDVRLRKLSTDNKLKAVASVTFDNEFVVHDIKVIEGERGLLKEYYLLLCLAEKSEQLENTEM